MKEISYKVEVDVKVDGDSYHVSVPVFKGLHTCGDSEEEALDNAIDAIRAYINSLIKHGDPLPLGVTVKTVTPKRKSPTNGHHTKELVVAT
ncbi:MAG: type II toxin-antitoxin system HicB family antitoxin [Chloroflexi bacterium]|nr:type II toxin-antitoxin system HicB family antitoxin [Chloroflexota bacterium]